jgi:two-component system, NarL family, response regulator LiaR
MEFMENQIRVLLVEDEAIVGKAVCALLARDEAITVIGEAGSAAEAVRKAKQLKPDVILMDLHLPDQSGTVVVQNILQDDPTAHILILTANTDEREVVAAFRAGAIGYVLKTQAIAELTAAIHNAYHGKSTLHPAVARMMLDELHRPHKVVAAERALSTAEQRILTLVAEGLSDKEIARRLAISPTTVRAHVSHILNKLHLSNRTQATLYAVQKGLVSLADLPEDPKRTARILHKTMVKQPGLSPYAPTVHF